MAIDATERFSNVKATVHTYLSGLTITGTPDYSDADERRKASETTPWARVTIEQDPPAYDGHYSATEYALRQPVVVTVDLFWPASDTSASVDIYAIDRAAEEYAHSLRMKTLVIGDYATDPVTPPELTETPLIFQERVRTILLPPDGGLIRRQVRAEGFYHMRHTR